MPIRSAGFKRTRDSQDASYIHFSGIFCFKNIMLSRTICKVACKAVGDLRNFLAEGSSKEACERIRSLTSFPIVKVVENIFKNLPSVKFYKYHLCPQLLVSNEMYFRTTVRTSGQTIKVWFGASTLLPQTLFQGKYIICLPNSYSSLVITNQMCRGACEPKGGEIVNKNIKPG